MKRRIKEAYRKHKQILKEHLHTNNAGCDLALVFLEKEIIDYEATEQKIIRVINRLCKEIREHI